MILTTFAPTGKILRWLEVPTAEDALANLHPDERVMLGRYDPATQYVESHDPADPTGTAVVVDYPPSPGPWAVWDWGARAWADPRTPVELAAALNAKRATAWLDKSDLLIRLIAAGIMSPEDAEEAAGGAIPASMAPLMEMLPPGAQMAARIKWRSDTQISRTHPVIVLAAHALGISDEQLDQIFGVAP